MKSDIGLYTFWIVLTKRNTECKTWNNGYYILYIASSFHVQPFMIDYIKLWLTLAISFHGNFHMRRKETFV